MCGPGRFAGVNFAFQVQIGVSLHASRCAHRGHATGQVETRSGKGHLWHEHRRIGFPLAIQVWACDVEEMVVHPHDAWHHCVSAEVKNRDSLGSCNIGAIFDCRNLSVLDDNVPIFHRCRARAVNHPHMRQNNFRRVHPHKLLYIFGKLAGLCSRWQSK